MKINSIDTIKSMQKNQQRNKFNFFKQSANGNSFDFSSVSSNAIRANSLASISFKGKKLGTTEARQREMKVIVEAFNVYTDVMQVFRNTAPDCAKESKELYKLASQDIKNASNDKCLTLEQTIYNGEIVPHKLHRNDRLGQPIYSAEFSKGKISQINEYDMSGNVSKVIKYNEETGDVLSYQKNTDDKDYAYDYLIEYNSEYGISELAKYSEKPTQDSSGNYNYARVIEYVDEEILKYKEDVVSTPQGEEIKVKRMFDFENLSTFDYCSSISKSQSGEVQQSEKIRIKNNDMVFWA